MSKPAKKCGPEEKLSRITKCLEWIREGYTRTKAVQEGSALWKVTTRQVDDYFSKAMETVKAEFDKNAANIVSDLHTKMLAIYDKAMFGGVGKRGREKDAPLIYVADLNVARLVLGDIGKLTGVIKDQIDVNDIKAPDLSNIPKEKLVAKLRRKTTH